MKDKGTSRDYTTEPFVWDRMKPTIQSDFLCRPYVVDLLGDVLGKNVADIGCGEGYVSRLIAEKGVKKIVAIEISRGMIEIAKKKEVAHPLGIEYFEGSAADLNMVKPQSMDSAVSVLVYGHFNSNEMDMANKEAFRILKSNGEYVVAVPHPFMYVCKLPTHWYGWNYEKLNYWDDKIAEITLFDNERRGFDISAKHHTIGKYLNSLTENGFVIEKIVEPQAKKADMKIYPDMWGEEDALPTYLIIKARKAKV